MYSQNFFLVPSKSFLRLLTDFEEDGDDDESEGEWQQELQRRYEQDASFMAELRARHPTSPPGPDGQQVGAPFC